MVTDLTLLEPQSRFGDKPLKFQVPCPQNGTAVLKGLSSAFVCLFVCSFVCSFVCFSSSRLSQLLSSPFFFSLPPIHMNGRNSGPGLQCMSGFPPPPPPHYASQRRQHYYNRGTKVNRTYGTHNNLYISSFLLTIFGPSHYGPPIYKVFYFFFPLPLPLR